MFWVWEHSIFFPYKFMEVTSLLYVILAYEEFYRTVLLSDGVVLVVVGGICTLFGYLLTNYFSINILS